MSDVPPLPAPSDSTARFDALLRAAATTVDTCQLTVDGDGMVLVASSTTLAILGRNHKELSGAHIRDVLTETNPATIEALLGAETARIETQVRLPDAELRWVEVIVGPVPDGGELRGSVIVIRDIDALRASNEELSHRTTWFDRVLSSAPMLVFVLDQDFTPLVPMSSAGRVFKVDFAEAGVPAFLNRVHAYDRPAVRGIMAQVQHEPGVHLTVRFRVQGSDMVFRWFEAEAVNRLNDGGVRAIVGSVREVTQKVQSEEKLRQSEERYALIARASDDALWDWALDSTQAFLSPRYFELVGLNQPQADGDRPNHWFDRVHPDESGVVGNVIQAQIQGGADPVRQQFRLRHEDGTWRWIECRSVAVRGTNGRAVRLAGSLTDITDRVLRDASTGLPTRAVLVDRIGRCVERARRDATQGFSVLVVALERFDVLRGDLDRSTAERLLTRVARRAEDCLRGTDSVARLDGTRLGVLLESVDDVTGAHRAAERLHEAFSRPIEVDGRDFFSDVQIGISLWTKAVVDAEGLLGQAESALARAIVSGAHQTAVYDPDEHKRALDRIQIEGELRQAIAESGLSVVFQPIVRMDGGDAVGAEALCRWNHARRGFVPPSTFIPVAEASDLIGALDRWVLGESVRHSSGWRAGYISVNLSARELRRANLAEEIVRTMGERGFPPSRLRLELTETALVENAEEAHKTLRTLRDAGVHLALDDFGTGYASLAYLRRFPFDVIKIDRSFVSNVETDRQSRAITTAILALARELSLDVVAEGVETESQRLALLELGCTYGQGYLWSRPVPPAEIHPRFV